MIYVSGFSKCLEEISVSLANSSFNSELENSGCFLKNINVMLPKVNCDLVSEITFSWSHLLIISGGEAVLCGFFNGKCGQVLQLQCPGNKKIIQGCCTDNLCHLVAENGEYWLYFINTGEWKDVGLLLGTEQDSVGGVYSVPSLLVFPKVKVLDICCGKEHAMILTVCGDIFTWGNGSKGQLGHGELELEEQPRELRALSGLNVVAIAAGGWHSCCITDEGDLYSWGWNCSGQLGFPGEEQSSAEDKMKSVSSVLAEPRPVDWPGEEIFVKQVACGSRHTIVQAGGALWGCGWNKYGQLSHELPEQVFGMTKISLPLDVSNVVNIVCGQWNSAFIT
ncbi:RCC1 domain-containing protein 1-like isoform X2 [Lycorma delicatula]|uniref:RCC1 domain-containing protein 1-like isoform X2 n=1 Tax=Lycorma delicatula TaxID=130591 RepID=UPI003F511753